MTLMPVSRISALGLWSSRAGASRWMGERAATTGGPPSMGLPARSNMRPSTSLPTGTVIGRAGAARDEAAREPLGRLHRDAAGHAVAGVQQTLDDDLGPVLALDLDRVEDGRQLAALEAQVEDRPRYANYPSNAFAHVFLPQRAFKKLVAFQKLAMRSLGTLESLRDRVY